MRVPPPGLAQPKAAAAKQAPVKQEAVAQASKPEQARRQAQLTPQVWQFLCLSAADRDESLLMLRLCATERTTLQNSSAKARMCAC